MCANVSFIFLFCFAKQALHVGKGKEKLKTVQKIQTEYSTKCNIFLYERILIQQLRKTFAAKWQFWSGAALAGCKIGTFSCGRAAGGTVFWGDFQSLAQSLHCRPKFRFLRFKNRSQAGWFSKTGQTSGSNGLFCSLKRPYKCSRKLPKPHGRKPTAHASKRTWAETET